MKVVFCFWMALVSWKAVAESVERQPLPEIEQIQSRLEDLGALDFAERILARDRIREWSDLFPRYMLGRLVNEYAQTENLEVRYQLEKLIRDLAADVLFYQPPAFLGVNFELSQLPDGRSAILLKSVIPDSAAEKAGLREGDFILQVGGMDVDRYVDVREFAEQIQQRLPMEVLSLRVLRKREFLTTVILGVRDLPQFQVTEFLREQQAQLDAWMKTLRPHRTESTGKPIGDFRME